MQLKKRFSVRRGVAAGAMAVAMFATSMPAMASNGLGLGLGHGTGLRPGLSVRAGADAGFLADLSALKTASKEVRDDLKSFLKGGHDTSATDTSQSAALKQCRKTAKDARVDAVSKARTERDSGLKSAVETYLSALTQARATFHAAVDASATGTPATEASLAARLAYRTAVSDALKAFRASKASVTANYRAELKAARATEKAADEACKP